MEIIKIRNAFEQNYPEVKIFYSYKTNCIPGLLKILHKEGCGAEVISPYELWLANRLGVNPSNIIMNGVIKSEEHLENARIERKRRFSNYGYAKELEY